MKAVFRERVELKGISPLLALDKLIKQKIAVYKVKKVDVQRLQFEIKSSDLQKVFAFFANSCYTITSIGQNLPQRIKVFCNLRMGVLIGLLCFFLLAFCSNFFIFKVHVTGSGENLTRQAEEILKSHNIKPFTLPNAAAFDSAKTELITLSGIEYVQIQQQGSVLHVTLFEAEESKPLEMQKALIATHSGVVERLTVLRGTPLVQVGDYVKKGQILVSGQFIDSEGQVYETTAIAKCTLLQTFQQEHIASKQSAKEESKAVAKTHFAVGGEITAKDVQVQKVKEGFRYTVTLTVRQSIYVNL